MAQHLEESLLALGEHVASASPLSSTVGEPFAAAIELLIAWIVLTVLVFVVTPGDPDTWTSSEEETGGLVIHTEAAGDALIYDPATRQFNLEVEKMTQAAEEIAAISDRRHGRGLGGIGLPASSLPASRPSSHRIFATTVVVLPVPALATSSASRVTRIAAACSGVATGRPTLAQRATASSTAPPMY